MRRLYQEVLYFLSGLPYSRRGKMFIRLKIRACISAVSMAFITRSKCIWNTKRRWCRLVFGFTEYS